MASTKKVKELHQRREEVFLGGGEKAIQKQVAMGKLTARERVLEIVDEGDLLRFDAEGDLLVKSTQATFERRETPIPKDPPIALTELFANDSSKTLQWNAFRRKGKLAAPELPEVMARLSEFLLPLLSGEAQGKIWQPESAWTHKSS